MIQDWKDEIVVMVYVKQELIKFDVNGIWPHCLPEIAATEEQILEAEKHLGHSIDLAYRNFLRFANGWKGFYQTSNLFGTNELSGSPEMEYAHRMLNAIEDEIVESSGFSREDLLPIASTIYDKDLFVITRPWTHSPGLIIWFAGDEIDRFENFEEFFLAMVDYNRLMVKRLKTKQEN